MPSSLVVKLQQDCALAKVLDFHFPLSLLYPNLTTRSSLSHSLLKAHHYCVVKSAPHGHLSRQSCHRVHHCFLATYSSSTTSTPAMASIPLLCNICPKHPDFSDISHLLTHVSSKGHLSHYFKAQVRSRQEPQILQQLEVYDRWYDKYHIEQLLSQRMVLKESKNVSHNIRNASNKPSASGKAARGTKKPAKVGSVVKDCGPRVKDENVIDPQLSQTQPTPTMALASRQSSLDRSVSDLASQHRAFAPHMRVRPNVNSPEHGLPKMETKEVRRNPRVGGKTFSESGSDSERLFCQSPMKSIYPDPSTISGLPRMGAFRSRTPVVRQDHKDSSNEPATAEYMPAAEEEDSNQSPKLKGICWPGMDIFDSASPTAQRQRNQKKDDSILKQMELNSIVVEPLEKIYWPEGTLKKERIITGMVESSPLKEESPKPRRRRTTRDKGILKNASTNNSQATKLGGLPKRSLRNEESHPADLGDLSKRALAMLDPPTPTYPARRNILSDPAEDENVEWELTAGDSKLGRKRRFAVYDDDATEDEKEQTMKILANHSRGAEYGVPRRPFSQAAPRHSPSFSHTNLGMPFPMSANSHLAQGPGYGFIPANGGNHNRRHDGLPRTLYSDTVVNKENIEPVLNYSGRIDNAATQAGNGRASQRYFSVTRGSPPEYFDTLPPHMVFGGWPGPRSSSSSFNPLNPNAQHHHVPQPYRDNSRVPTPASAQGLSPLNITTANFAVDTDYLFGSGSPHIGDRNMNHRRERF